MLLLDSGNRIQFIPKFLQHSSQTSVSLSLKNVLTTNNFGNGYHNINHKSKTNKIFTFKVLLLKLNNKFKKSENCFPIRNLKYLILNNKQLFQSIIHTLINQLFLPTILHSLDHTKKSL